MLAEELGLGWTEAGLTVITAVGIYVVMIALSRAWGQRQFSTSSTYDLAFVFALGSLIGRVVLIRTTLLNAVVALVTMFAVHAATGWLHHNIPAVHRTIQNRPILLVANGDVIEHALKRAHTSHLEVYQQLRLSGFGSIEEVRAVILERNGEMSVIPRGQAVRPEVFDEVVGRERLTGAGR
ncbi:MAG TPA: YetF domain-containing protein [Nitriliruptorales bacterium]|nr:YetF domain-containing protein [Nitriliruptorales bacterium]